MAGGKYDSSLTRVRPFFGQLIAREPTGASWLPQLLQAAPRGPEVLARVATEPGELLAELSKPAKNGLLRCFEYPIAAPRALLLWFIEHPDRLTWPKGQTYSESTTESRRALLYDEPPGRAEAQKQALRLAATRPTTAREWWRFEGESMLDCVLMTDRLVVTVEGKRTESLSPATHWYPKRSQLVRNLEAAGQMAHGRAWASLLLTEAPIPEGTDEGLDSVLVDSAPHLSDAQRRDLHSRYLGNLTWAEACAATGVAFSKLPETTDDLL